MIWLILGLLVTAGLFGVLGLGEEEYKNRWNETRVKIVWKIRKRQAIALCGLLICMISLFTKVPANHVGIVYSPFGGTKTETLSEGFKTKSPLDKIYKISTETQTKTIENLTTQTKDAQFVTTVLDIQYKVSPSNAYLVFKQYRTLDKMSETLITQTSQRVLELITTNYNVVDILGERRADVYGELKEKLTTELALYGVEFVSITINDMDAGEKLEAAITEEAVAKKAVETAEQNLLKAEMDAKQKSVQAKAKQEAAIIEAETKLIEAEAEKKANELLNQSLSADILQKQWIDKWNGEMPKYYGGDANLMVGVE